MAVKDLSVYLAPNLELPWGNRVFVVPPPTKDVGLKLAAINAAGVAAYLSTKDQCPTCGNTLALEELPEETRALLEAVQDVDLGRLSLGEDVYAQMLAAGVPGADVDTFAVYALYYWVLGEEAADEILAATRGGGAQGGATSGSSTSTRGPRTASESRTRSRASTRGTAGSPQR